MTQEVLEILEKLSLNGFELKVETKNNKRYISIVTNLNTATSKTKTVVDEITTSPITKFRKSKGKTKTKGKKKYFTPYMTFIKAIRNKHPELNNSNARTVGKKFMKDYEDILKVSKKDFNEIMSNVNFKYYI